MGRSTETAISELVNLLEKAKCNNLKAIVISIDIEGAFDSVPFDVIKEALETHGVEPAIINWIDYLSRNRSAQSRSGNSKIIFRPLEGTTQGGLNGPDIWIIVLWSIIFTAAAKSSHLLKFADDLISALIGKDLGVIRDVLQVCLDEFNNWFTARGLKISAKKSFCLIIDPTRNNQSIRPLKMGSDNIPIVKEFKYLGVVIDSGLTWKPHIYQRIAKAKKDLMAAKKMISTNWGLSPDKMAWIYEGIVRPALDYSCQIWTPTGPFPSWLRKELDKVQRLALLCITSCIYTTPTKALERLTDIPPLELHLKCKAATIVSRIYNSLDKANWDGIGIANKRGHLFKWMKYLKDLTPITPANTYNFNQFSVNFETTFNPDNIQVFTDGSKINDKVGAGWVIMLGTGILVQSCRNLPDYCTVFEAEMMALILALKDLQLTLQLDDYIFDEIDIYTDNQATLHAIKQIKLSDPLKVKLLNTINLFKATSNSKLNFFWIKGHSGVRGNELADFQAKQGAKEGVRINIPQSLSYIKKSLHNRKICAWDKEWNNLDTCRQSRQLITFTPNKKQSKYLLKRGRNSCRKLVALMTGHNYLKYHIFNIKFNTNPSVSPYCRYCEEQTETSWHMLMECPRLDSRRRERIFSPDNPKTGPDIEWWHGLAQHLGFLDFLTDRRLLDDPVTA